MPGMPHCLCQCWTSHRMIVIRAYVDTGHHVGQQQAESMSIRTSHRTIGQNTCPSFLAQTCMGGCGALSHGGEEKF
eukprot:2387116-Rhodomonas_salina.1